MLISNKIKLMVAVTLAFWSHFIHADFELGMNYYNAGNFENAYKEFYEAARYGDHDAQNNIGVMYYRGEYQPKNITLSYAWMALAAQNEPATDTALHNKILAKMTEAEQKIAKEEFQKLLAEYGDAAIEEKLTPAFSGTSLDVKSQRAIKRVPPRYPDAMLQQRASGFVDMVFTIDKHGFTRDHTPTYSVSTSFTKAAITALRQFQFEPMKVNGKPVDVNGMRMRFTFEIQGNSYSKSKLEKTIVDMREKAESGSDKDKLGYAYFLELLPSFASDYKIDDNPNKWYVEAANQGNGVASYFLGRNILYGNMCTQDSAQSMGWLLKAAKSGVVDAQYMLAIESFSGARFEKNEDKAFYWLTRSATTSPSAKLRYAWILATHPNTKRRDGKLANQYLSQIAKNHLDRQTYLRTHAAVAAENGDFRKAIKWQKQALKDAQELDLPDEYLQQQLASYSAQKPWREEI